MPSEIATMAEDYVRHIKTTKQNLFPVTDRIPVSDAMGDCDVNDLNIPAEEKWIECTETEI